MLLSKQKFDDLCFEYSFIPDEIERACELLCDLMEAEAKLTEQKYPYAHNTTSRLTAAAYQLSEICGDIAGDCFDEGEDS